MPTPDPRTPICIARGNLADLQANIKDLKEGEICYAFDKAALYMLKKGSLIKVSSELPLGVSGDLMKNIDGSWSADNVVDGGNF